MILSPADYPDVRAAIDVSLDEAALSDAVIEQDGFVRAAEWEVVSRDPLAETRTGEDAARVRLAAVCLTAARLVPAIRRLTVEQVLDARYQWQAVDEGALVATLRGRADAALAAVLTPDAPAATPYAFSIACGYRGR